MDIKEVADDQYAVGREEAEKRHFLCCQLRQFGYNLHRLPLFLRQLVLHLERADGIYLISKEVDTERQFTGEGIDI